MIHSNQRTIWWCWDLLSEWTLSQPIIRDDLDKVWRNLGWLDEGKDPSPRKGHHSAKIKLKRNICHNPIRKFHRTLFKGCRQSKISHLTVTAIYFTCPPRKKKFYSFCFGFIIECLWDNANWKKKPWQMNNDGKNVSKHFS